MKKLKFREKILMNRQKAHTQENSCSNVKTIIEDEQFEKKKKCEAESQRSNKKVFILSHEPKTPRSRDTEISSVLNFQGWCNLSEEKRS